ncbi:MAG: hypothetical protein CMN41_08010 [SAR116 cluster bacterium]|nr:hypothetical protein [SAR116 cluster bacterium]|tara:strand:+ start:16692 stop:16925 length:234 start_codon:yes stop_codon:yes gene_type:complete
MTGLSVWRCIAPHGQDGGPDGGQDGGQDGGADMNRIGIVLIVIAGLVGAGLFALSAWKIPAPTVAVNKVVPNDQLPN